MGRTLAVADRPELFQSVSKQLLSVLDALCAERRAEPQSAGRVEPTWPLASALSREDEQLVAALRAALERLPPSPRNRPAADLDDLRKALDGAEYVIRQDIAFTRGRRLPRLLPGLVFLTTLPICGEEEALRVSAHAGSLLAAD